MTPDHADLEADYLVVSLRKALETARLAYEASANGNVQNERLYLANLVGRLEDLHDHYNIDAGELADAQEAAAGGKPRPKSSFFKWLLNKDE
jgi:hypothetical protein